MFTKFMRKIANWLATVTANLVRNEVVIVVTREDYELDNNISWYLESLRLCAQQIFSEVCRADSLVP